MDEVRKPSAQIAAMAEHWTMIDALMGGTATMRAAGKRFMPAWQREENEDYAERLGTATLFPAYARTVSVLTGKPFSKPLTIGEDVPTRIASLLDNVDLEHRNLHAFASAVAADALGYGLNGILVDCPPNPGARSIAEERQAGIRPYLVHVRPGNILGWRSERRSGQQVLTQLRLLEIVEEADGPFGTKPVEQVRVLAPGLWSIWRKVSTAGADATWQVVDGGTTSLDRIPFVPVYGRRTGFMAAEPPMLDLAYANVEHWQSKSDQQTILHVARVPILFARGIATSQIKVGANSFIAAESETAEVKYVEHSGAAIEAGRQSLLDLEDRMRQAGAELLVIKPGGATVAQTLADNEQGKCDLQRIVQELEDALDQALALMGEWIGESQAGHVDIYDDFGAATLAEAGASLLVGMRNAGTLSNETLVREMQRRGIVSPDVNVKTEVATARAEFAARAPVVQVAEQIKTD